jgi:hypothetical protein
MTLFFITGIHSIARNLLLTLILGISFSSSAFLQAEGQLSPASQKAVSQFRKLDQEIEFGTTIAEKLLRCSHLQDAWLLYLQEAENKEDFIRGMTEIDQHIDRFHQNLKYAATVVNFYNPGKPRFLIPQKISIDGKVGFLNTFKTGRTLTDEERETIFDEEYSQYQKEAVVEPFEINETTLGRIEHGRLYNFALLVDGTIRIALEKPGGKEYLLNQEVASGDFAYPNHTILAGSANQPLLTAGALILYRAGDKELVFVSNKSGHYVPSYFSLQAIQERLESFGIDRHAIICVPTVDLGDVILSIYHTVQIPVSLLEENIEQLFLQAHNRWKKIVEQIDLQLLEELSNGEFESLTRETITELNHFREEASFMRSSYKLLTKNHTPPPLFHKFVKRFGKLKDYIKHNVTSAIPKEAAWVRNFILSKKDLLLNVDIELAQEEDLYCYLLHQIQTIKALLAKEQLTIDEFHIIKKTARELGTFFSLLAEKACKTGRNFFLYHAAAWKLLRINQQMAVVHDEQVGKILHGESDKDSITLTVSTGIQNNLIRILNQLGIAPPLFKIDLQPNAAFQMINKAKEWYFYHYYISCHPEEKNPELRNYNPLPKRFLEKLQNGSYIEADQEDVEAVDLLKSVLRKAEIAKHALIFIDINHEAPAEIDLYIDCLQTILDAYESNNFIEIENAVSTMLDFMNHPGLTEAATKPLQNYQCSDQKSFEDTFENNVSALRDLLNSSISHEAAREINHQIQSVADFLNLYLLIGQKHHTLPSIVYEEALHDCEALLEELRLQMLTHKNEAEVNTSPKLQQIASRLIKRF